MRKPVWCGGCKRHAWTRQQILSAWMSDIALRCPEPDCEREVSTEILEEALRREGMLNTEDDDDGGI